MEEVEQLLEQEERDILQQNATPNLGKISTRLAGQIHYMDMLLGNGLHIDLADKEWSGEVRSITYSVDGKSVSVVYRVMLYGTDAE
ncbi:unnamed protein product [Camellia sinensis]